ncbi:uncharacterized protein E0L32_011481 [Thyridium curvatum]|uniref:Uncharacterized protein n=1 Tax=Thyridium curvatum TaxID=1093900 RepID=A0A507B905_9PEZI|nr:uncharacterized protein E0L32_011481 [Thyridium curvatum]TPX18802.1 hypothetical protein E0L32_011481 [Thyridium curvatum]
MAQVASAILINAVFSIPLILSLFPSPQPMTASVRIAAGSLSFHPEIDGTSTGGDMPNFELYDVRGGLLGRKYSNNALVSGAETSNDHVGDGQVRDIEISTTGTPEYIKLGYMNEDSDDPLCIAYLQVTSARGADFLTWNGEYGKQCGMKWYPSQLRYPGDSDSFRPACVWIGNHDASMPRGLTLKLTDFSGQSADRAAAAGRQWTANNDLICKAPGRMLFWKTLNAKTDCLPYYNRIPARSPEGEDQNPLEIMGGHTLKEGCDPGKPWIDVDLRPPPPAGDGAFGGVASAIPAPIPNGAGSFGGVSGSIPIDDPTTKIGAGSFGGVAGFIPIPTSTTTSLRGGLLSTMSAQPVGPTPEPTLLGDPNEKRSSDDADADVKRRRESRLKTRRALRARKDPCVNSLTISEHGEHSATEVCGSKNSWGADFVSTVERRYCDMCTREVWPLCEEGAVDKGCFHVGRRELVLDDGADEAAGLLGRRDELQKDFARVEHWKA